MTTMKIVIKMKTNPMIKSPRVLAYKSSNTGVSPLGSQSYAMSMDSTMRVPRQIALINMAIAR